VHFFLGLADYLFEQMHVLEMPGKDVLAVGQSVAGIARKVLSGGGLANFARLVGLCTAVFLGTLLLG
jgi:hypothetical protein